MVGREGMDEDDPVGFSTTGSKRFRLFSCHQGIVSRRSCSTAPLATATVQSIVYRNPRFAKHIAAGANAPFQRGAHAVALAAVGWESLAVFPLSLKFRYR